VWAIHIAARSWVQRAWRDARDIARNQRRDDKQGDNSRIGQRIGRFHSEELTRQQLCDAGGSGQADDDAAPASTSVCRKISRITSRGR